MLLSMHGGYYDILMLIILTLSIGYDLEIFLVMAFKISSPQGPGVQRGNSIAPQGGVFLNKNYFLKSDRFVKQVF